MRSLKVGDVVLISGRMFTGRDAVHAHLMKHEPPVDLRGAALYHCGPVVQKEGDGWRITAAGPTTSIREEPYQARRPAPLRRARRDRQGRHGREDARRPSRKPGAVYLNAVGGAAQFYARTIEAVDGVSLLEFGTPEAMWHLRVKDFPAIVTMDAHGNSLHKDVEAASAEVLARLAVTTGRPQEAVADGASGLARQASFAAALARPAGHGHRPSTVTPAAARCPAATP